MSLTNYLIEGLLPEEEKKKVVAVYGGGFKPPTSGHFAVVKQALKENPEIDEFIILIGGKPRNGITPDESILIWDIYKQYLPFKIEVKYTSVPPIKGIYNYAKEHPDEEVLFIIGAREGNEEDFKDIASRTTTLDKYPNLNLRTIVTQGGVSGTAARNASKISLEKFKPFVPSELSDEEVEQVYNIVADKITEGRKKKKDPKKGKGKKPEGSKRRLYTDEDPKDTIGIKFSTRQDIVDTLNKTSFKAKSHARQSQIINLIYQRVRAAYGRAKDPAVRKRLKTGLDYITKKKEASKKKTQRLKKLNEDITKSQLNAIENYADKLFAKLGIDIEFTKHFLDRVNDERNIKPISVPELMGMFKRLHKKHGKPLSKVDDDFDAVVKDFNSNINIPFAINVTPNDIDLVAKTVMRKKDFKTSTPVIALNENASYSKEINIKEKIAQLTSHMIDKGMNIEPLPSLKFVDGDSENAKDFFGKTAYYDPNTQTIVLYTEGRHPKDILRSYSHEMIHHIQYLEDRLGDIAGTDTTSDDHLDKIEQEANLRGTMTFRNWTDSILNESLNEIGDGSSKSFKWKEDPMPYVIYDHEANFTTDLGTKYEVYIDVYDDINFDSDETYKMLDIAFGVESQAANQITNKGELFPVMTTILDITKHYLKKLKANGIIYNPSKKSKERYVDNQRDKLYRAYIQKAFPNAKIKEDKNGIIVLLDNKPLNEAIVGEKIECDNCGWDWNIVDGGDDLFICHECGYDNESLNEVKPYKHKHGFNDKLGKDPFGLNQFAREIAEEVISEGRYDKLANKLSSIAFKIFKDTHDRGNKKDTFEFRVDHPDEEHDIPSKEFYFDFLGKVEITDDEYNVDGGANAGFDDKGDPVTPLLSVDFKIPKNPKWSTISMDLKDVVRHELEHLTQDGDNEKGGFISDDPKLARPSKYMKNDQLFRDMIDTDLLPKSDYFKLEKEVDAMLQGLYFKAKKSKRPFKDVIDDYLNIFVNKKTISLEDKEDILDIWRSRGKALSLPIFENQKQDMDYKIYSDMDGVLVDFEKGYEKLTGIDLKGEYRPDGEDFWKPIEQAGVGYWAGLEWMSDGKQLWSYLKPFNPALLSAPSRSQSSRIGKHVWVKHKIPGTKLILRYASQKQQLATPESVLIDDRQANIDQWEAAGGIGILHTSTDNTIKQLKQLGL